MAMKIGLGKRLRPFRRFSPEAANRIPLTMANTYSQIFLQLVFSVKYREAMLFPAIRSDVYAYIAAILRDMGHIPIEIGGTDDHIHILLSYNINQSIPDLVRQVKACSSKMIKRKIPSNRPFAWQTGYGVFSYSKSQLPHVRAYISNQVAHHKNMTMEEEFERFLQKFGTQYQREYIFKAPE